MTDSAARKLVLHDRHAALGARFAPFAGWEMPIRYASIIDEHLTVRNKVGLFDVSHMGEVYFRGPGAAAAIDRLITNDVAKLYDGRAMYTLMCYPDGGVVDDLIVYRLREDEYLICVNAGNRHKDFAWFKEHTSGDVAVTDESDDCVQLAVQGPDAIALVASLSSIAVADIKYYHAQPGQVAGRPCLISRTGYTGEAGFELYIPNEHGVAVFDALMAEGAKYGIMPVGLGARDTLRLEARMPLYGNDIDASTNPIEAGLGSFVKLDGRSFIGSDRIAEVKAAGPSRKLRGVVLLEKGVLRGGYELFQGDRRAGRLTSGGIAPSLDEKSIGLAYVDTAFADLDRLEVEIRGKRLPVEVTTKPFYKRA